ncbi:SpoIIIAH-like family protein [Peribacillus kribbensis]|uniref:SpoIIIAH-like family protein n=1 Tax=Peribacillus kribbensis TaxID=356658 RepID=UPI000410FD11|nr:SpoIIIAH-like family protein [Peribacillus kribbensis]
MLLKKQTVWLLTMLSLVVVLSVYYITTPQKPANDMAVSEEKKKDQENKKTTAAEPAKNEKGASAKAVTEPANDEVFEAMRMDIEDQRNKEKEDLNVALASDISTKEKNAAFEKIKDLDKLSVTEGLLESQIVAMNYEGALVKIDGNNVHVLVKSKKQSNTAANEIMNTVTKEIGSSANVAVEFQPK